MYTSFSLLKEQDESPPPTSQNFAQTNARPTWENFPSTKFSFSPRENSVPPPPPTTKSRFSSYNPIKTSFSAAVTPVPFLF